MNLSTEHDNELSDELKIRFKKTVTWNKYRSEMSKQTETNNSNYLNDPAFRKNQ